MIRFRNGIIIRYWDYDKDCEKDYAFFPLLAWVFLKRKNVYSFLFNSKCANFSLSLITP